MDNRILELVNDLSSRKGDAFRLAAMVANLQIEIDKEKLENAGHTEAAGVL